MTWSATILRGGDDLDVKPFEPVTSNGTILVDSTGETGVTSETVIRKLASKDTAVGVGLMEGVVVQIYNGSAWVDDTPSLVLGPMIVREIACVEHPDQPDLWKVDYMASSFGPLKNAAGAMIGTPQISVGVVSRPRMAAAYRADVSPPADVIATNAFTTAPWQTGTDIGGKKVDINTTEFMGFPIGSMLMESVEFQPLHHEFKTAVMTIIYDEWHHAQEMPLVNPQFSIPTTPDPTTAMSHTTTVLWNQTFWSAWDLDANNSIFFTTAEWNYLDTVFVAGP